MSRGIVDEAVSRHALREVQPLPWEVAVIRVADHVPGPCDVHRQILDVAEQCARDLERPLGVRLRPEACARCDLHDRVGGRGDLVTSRRRVPPRHIYTGAEDLHRRRPERSDWQADEPEAGGNGEAVDACADEVDVAHIGSHVNLALRRAE